MKDYIWNTTYSEDGEGRENFKKNLTKVNESRFWILDKIKEQANKKGRYKVKSVLEVGCGIGLDIEELSKEIVPFDYSGCDFTKKFVEELQKKYGKDMFFVEDAQNLSFDDKMFDCVYCRHLIEHCENPTKALEEILRVAKKFVVIGWFRINDNPTELGFAENKYGKFPQSSLNRDEMKAIVEQYGKIIEVEIFGNNENWLIRKK